LTLEEAKAELGSLRLKGTTGGYNKTIVIASNAQPNPAPDDTVDVHFEKVPTTANYSLSYIGSDGTETTFLQNVPFNSLQDTSQSAQPKDAAATTPEEQS
jgi:hypothetical protein